MSSRFCRFFWPWARGSTSTRGAGASIISSHSASFSARFSANSPSSFSRLSSCFTRGGGADACGLGRSPRHRAVLCAFARAGISLHLDGHLGPRIHPNPGPRPAGRRTGRALAFNWRRDRVLFGQIVRADLAHSDLSALGNRSVFAHTLSRVARARSRSVVPLDEARNVGAGMPCSASSYFLINLAPCPGFIPAPNMDFTWVMDHFLYLPIIGLTALVVAAVESLAPQLSPAGRIGGATVAIIALAPWPSKAAFTPRSTSIRKRFGLTRSRAIREAWPAYGDLGLIYFYAGRLPEAKADVDIAAKLGSGLLHGAQQPGDDRDRDGAPSMMRMPWRK